MARLTLPSRRELKRPEGSSKDAPLKKVSLTTFLYTSPVQIPPWWDQTAVPPLVGFTHFHSSTTSGSACLMSVRTRERVLPRQSPSSAILASISWEGVVSSCKSRFLFVVVARTIACSVHLPTKGSPS